MKTLVDIKKIYKLNPDIKQEDVENIMVWTEKQPHLPKITELQVIHFLYSCYNSNEQAKITIDNFFTVRTHSPEIFANRNPASPNVQQTIDSGLFTVFPESTPDDYKVVYTKLIDYDPSKFVYAEFIKLLDMVYMLWLHKCIQYPKGFVIVIDMEGATLGHLARLNVLTVKKFLYYLQEAWPIRLKGLHFVNVVSFMDKVMAIMRPFMKKELINMLYIHAQSFDEVYKFVPKDCFPKEYEGKAGSIAQLWDNMKETIMNNTDFFMQEEKQLVDESKRPGKPKSAGDLFGIEGTFKKLDID